MTRPSGPWTPEKLSPIYRRSVDIFNTEDKLYLYVFRLTISNVSVEKPKDLDSFQDKES